MKTLKRITYLLLLLVLVTSCDKDYDAPPLNMPEYKGEAPNITIKGIKEKYAGVTSAAPQVIDESLIVKVLVGANDISGNIFKQVIVQDETGGISIGVDQSTMYTLYRVGQEVFIDLKGFSAVNYGGELQIGYSDTQANRIPWETFKSQAHLNGWPDSTLVAPKIVAIKDLDVAMTNTVIQLDSVYFVNGGKTTFAIGDNTTSQTLMDKNGNSIDVRTSSYATFAKNTLPTGVGSLVGELGRFNGNWQFTIRSVADIKNFSGTAPDGETGTGTGTKEDPYDIASAIANQGEKDKWVKGYIVGAVPEAKISEAEFVAPFTNAANILIAASATETDPTKCFAVQLPYSQTSTLRADVNLKDNPTFKGREIVLRGDLEKYFGVAGLKNTNEYQFLGDTPTPEPEPETGKGTGTKEDPYDITNAIAKQGENGKWIKAYIVGNIPDGKPQNAVFKGDFTNASNILVAASPNETDYTKCFPIQLVASTDPRTALNLMDNPANLGKEVLLFGNLANYFGTTPGMRETSAFEFVGGTPTPDPEPEPQPSDGGTKENPYSIANAIANQGEKDKWVKGYIVGSVPEAKIADAKFEAPFINNANILIAASANETDYTKCFVVQLPFKEGSTLRPDVNLKDNPTNKGREILLKGNLEKYFGVAGMKSTSEFEFVK